MKTKRNCFLVYHTSSGMLNFCFSITEGHSYGELVYAVWASPHAKPQILTPSGALRVYVDKVNRFPRAKYSIHWEDEYEAIKSHNHRIALCKQRAVR